MVTLKTLMRTLPQTGRLAWIGVRPARREPLRQLHDAELDTRVGLVGDRYAGRMRTRQVTLIQEEHLTAMASLLGRPGDQPIAAEMLRRNLVVVGINLLALKSRRFRVGATVLEYTGVCHPCSRMEEVLGEGGYNAVRGHGGITAKVISGGWISVGDEVLLVTDD